MPSTGSRGTYFPEKSQHSERDSEGIKEHNDVIHWMLGAAGVDLNQVDHHDRRRTLSEISSEIRPYVWAALFCVLLIFFGGGGTVLSQGIFLCGVGLSMMLTPPLRRSTGVVWWGSWIFLGLAWLALLPMGFSSEEILGGGAGSYPELSRYPLGVQNIGQFAVAAILCTAGVGWLHTILAWRTHATSNQAILWILGFGISLLAFLFFADLTWLDSEPGKTTSFFPSRNQTAIVFAVGTVLGLGLFVITLTEGRLIPTMLAMGITGFAGMALFRIESRGGVVFALLGMLVFLGTSWIWGRSGNRGLKYGLPSLLVFGLILMLGDSSLRDRLFPPVVVGMPESEFRTRIWVDTWAMISEHPLGLGSGQFEAWIPQFLEQAAVGKAVTFPENDWLWFLSEQGWVAFALVVLALVGWMLTALRTARRHKAQSRFLTIGLAAVVLGHSLVDGGWHRVGIFLLGSLLMALCLRDSRTSGWLLIGQRPLPWVAIRAVQVGGLVAILIGGTWILGSATRWPVHPDLVESRAIEQIKLAVETRDPDKVEDAAAWWGAWSPLSWKAYFSHAAGYLRAGGRDEARAARIFRIAQLLEPNLAVIPFEEGRVWFERRKVSRGLAAWRMAIDRPAENQDELFNQMIQIGFEQDESREALISLSEFSPPLRLKVYERVEDARLSELMLDDVRPGGFGPDFIGQIPRVHLYRVAGELGQSSMEAMMPQLFNGEVDAWDIQFFAMLHKENHASMHDWVLQFVPQTMLPVENTEISLTALERQFANNASDPVRALGLANQYYAKGRLYDAIEVLETTTEIPGHTQIQAWEWLGRLRGELGDFKGATDAWRRYFFAASEIR
ncbi:MAG: O-antigen ligase family protein [Opitutales bacterium]|nr:O-antigen ligase family protein [Opitutales bacterium]